MGDEDWEPNNQEDQTCEDNTHHSWAVPGEPAI